MVLAIFGAVVGLGTRGSARWRRATCGARRRSCRGRSATCSIGRRRPARSHRLVLDLDDGKYWAEVSDDRFYVPREAETEADVRRREEKEAERGRGERREKKAEAKGDSSARRPARTPSFDLAKLEVGDFKPKRARFAAFKELALKPVKLKKAKIRSVYTPRAGRGAHLRAGLPLLLPARSDRGARSSPCPTRRTRASIRWWSTRSPGGCRSRTKRSIRRQPRPVRRPGQPGGAMRRRRSRLHGLHAARDDGRAGDPRR